MNACPKMIIVRDRKYLDWLHDQPCIITGQYGNDHETIDPAHIGSFKSMKRSDDEVLPVLHRFHGAGHNGGEMSMWRKELPDSVLREALRAYARQLYREYLSSHPLGNAPNTNGSET